MKIFKVGQGQSAGLGIESLSSDPDFRRSTENMAYAYLAMQNCIASSRIDPRKLDGELGLVLGTSHGELGATVDFLEELAKTGTARPLLFQASLHNATLGFLTKKFLITGPAFTVSDTFFSGEESLELALTLIETGILKYAFVVGVDVKVAKINEPLLAMYDKPLELTSGAACLLLCSEANVSSFRSEEVRQVLGLEICRKPQSTPSSFLEAKGYYDSNFIEAVASMRSEEECVMSVKPNKSFSTLRLKTL